MSTVFFTILFYVPKEFSDDYLFGYGSASNLSILVIFEFVDVDVCC